MRSIALLSADRRVSTGAGPAGGGSPGAVIGSSGSWPGKFTDFRREGVETVL